MFMYIFIARRLRSKVRFPCVFTAYIKRNTNLNVARLRISYFLHRILPFC